MSILLRLMVVVFLVTMMGCAEGGFHWITPEAEEVPLPTVTMAPEVVPSEEVGEVEPEPAIAPPCEEIKGNIARDGRKLYHDKDSPNYGQVKIDEEAGERWFCSAEEAEAAGWMKAGG